MFQANFYDGISARVQNATIEVLQEQLIIILDGRKLNYALKDCGIQAKLGNTQRIIDLPDGARLEYLATDWPVFLKPAESRMGRYVYFLETHMRYVFLSLCITVIAAYVFLTSGIPIAAKATLLVVPNNVDIKLGQQTLASLDKPSLGYLLPTQLPLSQQLAIKQSLAKLCLQSGQNCPKYQLMFRASPAIGANAFALPGDIVVMTDELANLAENNQEIVTVLAHELGHVQQRHAMRQIVASSLSGLMIVLLTGDVASFAAALPAFILQMSYSREMETEADNYALKALKKACISPKHFVNMMLRLDKTIGATPEWLTTHPETLKRLAPFSQDISACQHV